MKDVLVLLFLLCVRTTKVCSKPYQADSDGNCLNHKTEYLLDGSNLCCKKCPPGQRLKEKCTKTTETVCQSCPQGQYLEDWNYAVNCLSCIKCKQAKGLQSVQNCTPTTKSKCGCQPGRFCVIGFDGPYCSECSKYKKCPVGYGVSVPGRPDSDVKCERCPNGTFSNTVSHTDRCQRHTNCHGRVVRKGNATSDNVCEVPPQNSTKDPHVEVVTTAARRSLDSSPPLSLSVSEAVFNNSTKSPPAASESNLAAIISVIVLGVVFLLIAIAVILWFLWKKNWKKDAERFHPKVDANGNCETGDKQIDQDYFGETQLTSFQVTPPEQQCLLGNGEACSNQSQSSNNTDTLTRTDDCSSSESNSPLHSTVALDSPHSALSEPMTLLSNTDPVTPQSSISTQCSSQPTSPQIISPPTTSPHVNVNITFHIGSSSGGTPSVMPTDLMQVGSKLPFGEKEESFSIPQQEDGKQSLTSVQETASYGS